jgi:3-oxoacyl-[acyl-carrier protein] reductase
MSAEVHGERRAAVVMAATQGLGRACADALVDAGHDVLICARSAERVAEVAEALQARRPDADVDGIAADVSDPDALAAVFDRADERFGRLDVLVANAGGPPPGDFEEVGEDAWRRGFELTLMSAVRAMRHAVPRMRAGGFGRIVVLGSSSVRRPLPGLVLSNAYRPALAGVVKSLAVDVAPDGITVNMVSPGRIDTERVAQLDERAAERAGRAVEDVRADSAARIPAGRYGEPHELAALVAFLAFDAAGYITAQSIVVDGGQTPTLP